jgi:hypothetical protein
MEMKPEEELPIPWRQEPRFEGKGDIIKESGHVGRYTLTLI